MDISERTPLHWVALEGHIEVVKLLLEHGAKIDSKNIVLETPLHLAGQFISPYQDRTTEC